MIQNSYYSSIFPNIFGLSTHLELSNISVTHNNTKINKLLKLHEYVFVYLRKHYKSKYDRSSKIIFYSKGNIQGKLILISHLNSVLHVIFFSCGWK